MLTFIFYLVFTTGVALWGYALYHILFELVRSIWQTARIAQHLLNQEIKPTNVKVADYFSLWWDEFGTTYDYKTVAWENFNYYPWKGIDPADGYPYE